MNTQRLPLALVFLITLVVFGCTTPQQPVPRPETFNQSFLLAYALVDSSYQSVALAIQDPTIHMTREQAQKIKDDIDGVKLALDQAHAAFELGNDWDTGVFSNTRLTLNLVRQALISFGARSTP